MTDLDLAPRALALMTQDLPGTGGSIKITPEDFVVEEVPAYLPSGSGAHLYVWLEKRELTTQEAASMLAYALGVPERDVGYAGQKDRQALTRQWFSIPTRYDGVVLDDARVNVLACSRHANKLRLGHSLGNRFTIVVRDVVPDAEARAGAIRERLAATGLPNFFGAQRFGRRGDNARLGAALLGLGDHPERHHAQRDRHLHRLMISALQSEVFNRCLSERLADGLWDTVVSGDILQRRDGALFITNDVEADQARLARHELDITGPLPGQNERPEARDLARAREDRVLAACGIPREAFGRARDAEGARRAYRIPCNSLVVTVDEPGTLTVAFTLPPGSYATRVIAELTHAEP